jgi:photosystem II stability/assembly factor-like uncharacterized protein
MPSRPLRFALSLGLLVLITDCAARREREAHPGQWFMAQRLSGDGRIPYRALSRALEAREMAAADAPGSWVGIGPINIGGRVTALALDPNDGNHIWLGAAAGGVFTSANGGTTWTARFDDQAPLSIGSITAHPTDSLTAWVGTGEDNGGGFSYDGEGVYKTTDGGATWTWQGLAETRRIGRIAVDPTNPETVFVAAGGDWFHADASRGVYRSTNGGDTWEQVLFVANDTGAIDVAIDPSNPNRVYAAVWQRQSMGTTWYIGGIQSGVYRSLDGGDTWSKLTNGLPVTASVGRIGLAIAPSSPNVVYALVISNLGRLLGVYKTTDSGDTWVKISNSQQTNKFSTYSYYFGNIRVDPANPSVVYCLDVSLLKSTDGGVTFNAIATSVHPDWHALILATSSRMLVGNDAGFFSSVNGGSSWTHAATLPVTQLYDLGIDRLQPTHRFAGAQDNGMLRTITGGLSDWSDRLGGDGLQVEVDPTNSNVVYAETQYGAIQKSTNGGSTFTGATNGISFSDRTNWNTPITVDPVVPSTLYTGTFRVYRTTNAASSWAAISPDLTNGPVFLGGAEGPEKEFRRDHLENLILGTVTVVKPSALDNRIVWAGTDDGNVWVTTNSGSSWTKVNPPGTAYWVTDVEPDPFDADTAFLSVTGYRVGDRLPYVRVTHDLGASWIDLSAGLPQVPTSTVLPDGSWHGRLFVGNDVGVYVSDDAGLTWSAMSGNLPRVVVMDLYQHASTNALYAATHARSVHTFDLAQLPVPDGDGDGVDNNADCALADPGAFAAPQEVGSLTVAKGAGDAADLSWGSLAPTAGAGTVYDVAVGDLALLAVSGTGSSTSLACSVAGEATSDPAVPAPGAGVYYMVRGRNACGIGTWGDDRDSGACP